MRKLWLTTHSIPCICSTKEETEKKVIFSFFVSSNKPLIMMLESGFYVLWRTDSHNGNQHCYLWFWRTLPSSVPSVLSTEGPLSTVPFLPLTHWTCPTLISCQSQVPFSNEQPSNPPVSFSIKKKVVFTTKYAYIRRRRGRLKIKTQVPGQRPSVRLMSSMAINPLLLLPASIISCCWEDANSLNTAA